MLLLLKHSGPIGSNFMALAGACLMRTLKHQARFVVAQDSSFFLLMMVSDANITESTEKHLRN